MGDAGWLVMCIIAIKHPVEADWHNTGGQGFYVKFLVVYGTTALKGNV
jgi:hypothetical protein